MGLKTVYAAIMRGGSALVGIRAALIFQYVAGPIGGLPP
jgi:hypothetical protein